MTLFKIANWSKIYESHDTRKLENLRYVYLPNKHDGLGFRRLAVQKNPEDLFAAWILLVQIASKGRKAERGILARDGVPLDATDCAAMTGFPVGIFERALIFFSEPKMGWLEAESVTTTEETLPGLRGEMPPSPENLPLSPGNLPALPEGPGFPPPGIEGIEGIEGRGEKGGKAPAGAAASPVSSSFPANLQTPEFLAAWEDFKKHRSEKKSPIKPGSQAETGALRVLATMGPARAVITIRHTIFKGWQGLREPDANEAKQYQTGGAASLPPIAEPDGWRAYVNHEYPESIYADGGADSHLQWHQLARDVQAKFAKELRKQQ